VRQRVPRFGLLVALRQHGVTLCCER
jgi:hypothetical protein